MNDLLEELHKLAIEFRKIQMKQTAGDYDYLVAWLRSPMWTKNGEHLKPNPAGKNTVDAYSHNCPIPYYASAEIFNKCTNESFAEVFLTQARELLFELALEYIEDDEKVAIDAYIEYTDDLITILTGESPEPGPEPTPEKHQGICGVISSDSDEVLDMYDFSQMRRGNVSFIGSLCESSIPESGSISEYIPGQELFGILNSDKDIAVRFDAIPFGIIEID
jgi:hypothetical protein